jgi:hypothetical protein
MATRNNKSTGRLTELVSYQRRQGGSVAGSLATGIKERLKEKFDPRQLINQQGLLTALFPSLKTYQAKTSASDISKSSLQATSFDEIKPILETIDFNTKITAKNTLVLPALHRDVNVIRQNIVKLVKMRGGDARNKADMYFMKAKEREDKYERELKKEKLKQSKIQKLEEKEKDKNTSLLVRMFTSLFSVIKKGLQTILTAILSLGKTIVGLIRFMGSVIGGIISRLTNFFLNTVLGIDLTKKLKQFLKDFWKANFFRTVFLAIARALMSGPIIRLLLRRLVFPMAAIMGGKELIKSFLDRQMQEGEITLEDERKMFDQDLKEGQRIPVSSISGENLKTYKDLGLIPKDTAILGGSGEGKGTTIPQAYLNELEAAGMDKNIVFEYKDGKRQLYNLKIPGLTEPYLFALTGSEARQWGDYRRKYLQIIDKLIRFKQNQNEIDLSGNQLENLYRAYSETRSAMLNMTEKFMNENYTTGQRPQDKNSIGNRLKRNLQAAKERKKMDYLDILFQNVVDDAKDLGKEIYDTVRPQIEPELEQMEKTWTGLIDKHIFDPARSLKKDAGKTLTDITDFISTETKNSISQLTDLTNNNRRSSVVFKQPIIVDNTNVKKDNDQSAFNVKPSSAWNIEFIDDIFKQTSSFGVK